jgi:hypothetical protein
MVYKEFSQTTKVTQIFRQEFWKGLAEKYKKSGSFFANISPRARHYFQTGAGKSGIAYRHIDMKGQIQVDVYIAEIPLQTHKRYYNQLCANKEHIEKVFGKPLVWQPANGKNYSRIFYSITDWGLEDKEHWSKLQDRLVEEMYALRKAFQPEIDNLT